MRKFYTGWRRKAGVVALTLACVLMGLWLRQPLNQDFVQFELGPWNLTLASNQNGLWLVTSDLPGGVYQPQMHWGKHELFALPGRRSPFSNDPFGHLGKWGWGTERRWDWCGFHFGRYFDERAIGGIRLQFRVIPHAAIVIPVTLAAALLLFTKSRPSRGDAEMRSVARPLIDVPSAQS